MSRLGATLLIALPILLAPNSAFALIRGDAGNKFVPDPGWPKGASTIFNHQGRVAWWEGPPFGGGEWHSECRGDAKALSAVLASFAEIEVETKRLIVHDGVGTSFWLAPNKEPEKLADAKIGWMFTVWQPDSWKRLHDMPVDLNPTDSADVSPPSQIDVYAAGLDWAAVIVPKGLNVTDQRLESHGFHEVDGTVFEGKATDLDTGEAVSATIRLQGVVAAKSGGYLYPEIAAAKSDAEGRWVLKKVPSGWVRVVVEAEGYLSRIVGYATLDDQPRWASFDFGLAKSVVVSGRILDEEGAPLSGVEVRLDDVQHNSGGPYRATSEFSSKTDAEGRFQVDDLPEGKATVWLAKPGYIRPGLGLGITTPKKDVELRMMKSSEVVAAVDFGGKARPSGYSVKLTPEGGDVIGSHGGAGDVDAEGRITFRDLPPGLYTLTGRPNPGSDSEQTEPLDVELKGGDKKEVSLKAK